MDLGDNNEDLLSKGCNEANLRRLLKESNAIQLVNEPTRVTATSSTLLDHITVDRSVEVERAGVIDAAGIRDHRGVNIMDHKFIYCCIKVKKEKKGQKIITYMDFSKFNPESAIEAVAEIDWDRAMHIDGVDNIEHFITTHIKRVFDSHASIVCKRVTKKRAL
uniref:Endonuclease/exonuclease/phosphatase domain-containing protein n=1 Tax=Cuerna arida TaxID=1464854 RepID=A0A1B6GI71_9HEMI